jgi:hypothetical protein
MRMSVQGGPCSCLTIKLLFAASEDRSLAPRGARMAAPRAV